MKYDLKNCKNGEAGVYPTTVDISVNDGIITFFFECEKCEFFVPFTGYNKIHSAGDSCEILIGSDPERKVYYEIEISAKGELMIARMTYRIEESRLTESFFSIPCKMQSNIYKITTDQIVPPMINR